MIHNDLSLITNEIDDESSLSMKLSLKSLEALEKLIHFCLRFDINATEHVLFKEKKSLLVQLEPFPFGLFFCFNHDRVRLQAMSSQYLSTLEKKERPSVILTGTLSGFLASLMEKKTQDAIFKGELHFNGDLGTAQQFQHWMRYIDIDWEEMLSNIMGDAMSYIAVKNIKYFIDLVKTNTHSIKEDISEYLQEEGMLTPSDSEQQMFFDEVDKLRARTEQLIQKVDHFLS
jgi:ubiquinone biosynthesis protein UbiJ